MAERRFPVNGDVDLAVVQELQDELLVLVNTTNDDLVLDCTNLEFIDSTGIGVFIFTQRLLEVRGRRLRVENMSARCRRPFEILGFSDLLELPAAEPA